jgi:hypothetical protein
MPVEFADRSKTRRVKFVTGVHHEGVDYGPDYELQEADVNAAAAAAYVAQGRAVYVEAAEAKGGAKGK